MFLKIILINLTGLYGTIKYNLARLSLNTEWKNSYPRTRGLYSVDSKTMNDKHIFGMLNVTNDVEHLVIAGNYTQEEVSIILFGDNTTQ